MTARLAVTKQFASAILSATLFAFATACDLPTSRPREREQSEPTGTLRAVNPAATPELGSIALFGAGAAGMAGFVVTRIRASRDRMGRVDESRG